MVNVLPFVARNPSLSTLKNVANRMLSVVVAALRLLTSVSGTEPEKVSCIDLLAVPLGHVPTIDSLKNKVLFSLNTTILLLTVSKNGANVPDDGVSVFSRLTRLVGAVGIVTDTLSKQPLISCAWWHTQAQIFLLSDHQLCFVASKYFPLPL